MDMDTLTPLFTHRHKWESKATLTGLAGTPAAAAKTRISFLSDKTTAHDALREPQTGLVPSSSTTSSAVSSGKPNLLLLLPGEIRNTIYRLVLTSPRLLRAMQRAVAASHCSSYVLPGLPITAALVRTCRQIHAEATPILYEENTFVAHSTLLAALPHLVDPARPLCAPGLGARIRRWYIHVRIDCDARYSEQDLTRAFSGAHELEIEASQAMYQAASMSVLLLFKGVRAVNRVKVWGTCSEPFARWLETVMTSPEGALCGEYNPESDLEGPSTLLVPFDPWSYNR